MSACQRAFICLSLHHPVHVAVNACGPKEDGKHIGGTGAETTKQVEDWQECRHICETTTDCVGWVLMADGVNCYQKLKTDANLDEIVLSPGQPAQIAGLCQPRTSAIETTSTPTVSACVLASYKGDGYCDDLTNNAGCDYDGGDCCGDSVNTAYCSECACKDPGICTTTTRL